MVKVGREPLSDKLKRNKDEMGNWGTGQQLILPHDSTVKRFYFSLQSVK